MLPCLAILLAISAPPTPANTGAPVPFAWPARPRWRTETIPFPLDFAPEIPLRGVEELRFAPQFLDPEAPGYFSYAFVWWLEGTPELTRPVLAADLETYFAGLCNAVAKDAALCAREKHHAGLEADTGTLERQGHSAARYRGTMRTIEPFKARAPLTLDVELTVWTCTHSGRTAVLAKLSPHERPKSAPLAGELRAQTDSFRCHAK